MNSALDEACAILNDFEKEVAKVERDSTDLHRMWLHGATDIWERNELERWLTDYPPSTAIANSSAVEVCAAWRRWVSVAGPVKVCKVLDYDKKTRGYTERESREPSAVSYADHDKFEIQEPFREETLYDFIVRLAQSFENQFDEHQKCERKKREQGDWLEERALNSFLDFVHNEGQAIVAQNLSSGGGVGT